MFLICANQRLGKNPEEYPDARAQPQVQVAMRMKARGGNARAGDVMQYVFCLNKDEKSAKSAQADRAYHPDELRKSPDLKLGTFRSLRSLSILLLPTYWFVFSIHQILNIICRCKSSRLSSVFASPSKERTELVWLSVLVSLCSSFSTCLSEIEPIFDRQ